MSKNVVELLPVWLANQPSPPRALSEADRSAQEELIQFAQAAQPQRAPSRAELAQAPLEGLFTQAELDEAAAEFRSKGVRWPGPREVNAAMERNREARRREAEAREKAEAPSLSPTPQEAMLPTPRAKRPRGRRPKEPWWLPGAARLVASGLTLRRALRKLGVALTVAERRNVYRWKRFKELVGKRERDRDGGNFRD